MCPQPPQNYPTLIPNPFSGSIVYNWGVHGIEGAPSDTYVCSLKEETHPKNDVPRTCVKTSKIAKKVING